MVDSRPLTYSDGRLEFGAAVREDGLVSVRDALPSGALAPGDWVALHWDWVCDQLTSRQLEDLRRYSTDQLAIVNELLL